MGSRHTYTIRRRLESIGEVERRTLIPERAGLAIAVLSDMKNGKTTTLDKLRERQYGKPTQRMEVTGKDGAELIPARTLTKEEAQQLFKDLQENY